MPVDKYQVMKMVQIWSQVWTIHKTYQIYWHWPVYPQTTWRLFMILLKFTHSKNRSGVLLNKVTVFELCMLLGYHIISTISNLNVCDTLVSFALDSWHFLLLWWRKVKRCIRSLYTEKVYHFPESGNKKVETGRKYELFSLYLSSSYITWKCCPHRRKIFLNAPWKWALLL